MTDYAYYNGVITPYDSASIPLSDRAIFFADAVYDVLIGRQGNLYQARKHFERFIRNAEAIGLTNVPTSKELLDTAKLFINETGANNFVLYVQLSSNQNRRLHLRTDIKINLLMTLTDLYLPESLETVGALVLPDKRYEYCNIKTTNLLPSVLALDVAVDNGHDIAVFEKNGFVTEASSANVSIFKDGTLFTHPRDNYILPGISELNLIEACKELSIPNEAKEFSVDEMKNSDLVFVTSTTKLLKVCDKINGERKESYKLHIAEKIYRHLYADFYKNTSLNHIC